MTWYSCCYDNKRTLKILAEVAFDNPDSTSLFLFHWINNYCRLNLISRRFFFSLFSKISVYFFILSLQSWWHISLSWLHCRHWWVCSEYPQLQQGQCHLYKYRGIVQLFLWSWIQRGWTQLCRCEKYDCFPVSASRTYIAWPSCPQKFL